MSQIRVTVFGLDEFQHYLTRFGSNFPKMARTAIVSASERTLPALARATETAPKASDQGSMGAVATGAMRSGWYVSTNGENVIIANRKAYSGAVDGGRRAAAVSYQGIMKIQEWAKRRYGVTGRDARAIAFGVARRLRNSPLWPRKIFSSVVPQLMKNISEDLSKVLHALGRGV